MPRIKIDELKDTFGPTSKLQKCWICEDMGIDIYHRHHSTVAGIRYLDVRGRTHYNCVTCKTIHPIIVEDKAPVNVLVTSSTLHDAWRFEKYKAEPHFDVISICGGNMEAGRINFYNQYCHRGRPFHVAVLLGINDVKRISVKDFELEMIKWVYDVEVHQEIFKLKNRISFIKFPRAPQQYWHQGNGLEPNGYVRYNDKVDAMLAAIHRVNITRANSLNVVSLEHEGKRTLHCGKYQHEWALWREQEPGNMLHLHDFHRWKMLTAWNCQYFLKGFWALANLTKGRFGH